MCATARGLLLIGALVAFGLLSAVLMAEMEN